jgi:hypothetical protein
MSDDAIGKPGHTELDKAKASRNDDWELYQWLVKAGFTQWSTAERRLLLITVIGGLIVNIATVLFVGLGLAFIRSAYVMSPGGRLNAFVAFTSVLFVLVAVSTWARRKKHRLLALVIVPSTGLLGALMLTLILVGLAQGSSNK